MRYDTTKQNTFINTETGPSRLAAPLDNQRGTALIIALGILSIMTIMGMLAMSTSDTELSISGNYRSLQESFFAADRAVTYAATNPDIYLGSTPIDLFADATHKDNIEVGRSGLDPTAPGVHLATPLGSGPPPPGSVSDAGLFEARYLMITATGAFPIDSPNPARTEVETQVARIIPKL